VIEVVPDLPDVSGRLAEDLGEFLAPNALVGLAVRVVLLAAGEPVVLLIGRSLERLRRRVEVRLEADDLHVLEFVLGGPPEHVHDRSLLVAVAGDRVVDLHHGELEFALGFGEGLLDDVDHLCGVRSAVTGDGNRLFCRPVVGLLGVAAELRESGLARLSHDSEICSRRIKPLQSPPASGVTRGALDCCDGSARLL